MKTKYQQFMVTLVCFLGQMAVEPTIHVIQLWTMSRDVVTKNWEDMFGVLEKTHD